MNRHYKTLELDKVLQLLAQETSIPEAGERALSIEPEVTIGRAEELQQ